MSDSVGKISLDLELQSDLSKQISKSASKIGEQLKVSLQNIGNLDFNKMTSSISDTLKNTMDKALGGINTSIESVFSNAADTVSETINIAKENALTAIAEIKRAATEMMQGIASMSKNIKIPLSFPRPTDTSMPSGAPVINPTMPRAPSIPKINTGFNMEALKAQIDNLTASLDVTNAKIEQQKEKLAQLKQAYSMAFNEDRKNKLQEQILKTEETINKLIASSDKAGFKLADLDAQFETMGRAAKNATAGVKAVEENLGKTSNLAKKAASGISLFGNNAKDSTSKASSGFGMMGKMLDRMIIRMFLFNTVMKGLSTLGTFMGNALMTNVAFANSLAQVKSNLEVAFMPIYQAALPALVALMNALAKATTYVAAFINSLFGKTYQASATAAKGLNLNIAKYQQLKKETEKWGDSTQEAAKKAKGALAGFDEINLLSMDKEKKMPKLPSVDAPMPIVAPPIDVGPTSAAMKNISNMANSFKKVLATLFQPMKTAWAKDGAGVMAEFNRAVNGSKETIKHFFNMLATPPVQKFLENIDRLVLAIIKLGLRIYNEFILPIINWFIDLLPGAANGINPILEAVTNFVNYLSGPGIDKVIQFCVALRDFFAPILQNIKNVLLDVWNNALVPLGKVLMDIWKTIIEPLAIILRDVLGIAFKIVSDIVKDFWKNVMEPLGSFLKNIFMKIIQSVIEIWKAWKPVIQPIIDIILWLWKNALEPLMKFLGGVFVDSFHNVFRTIGQIIKDLQKVFNGIIDFITGVFTGNWSRAWSGVVNIFGGIFDGIAAIAKMPLNAVIGLINGAIGSINDISINIPGWVPKWGGKHFGADIPHIPYLARGGIIDQPTLSMVGEAGKEAVVPLENNTQGLDLLAEKLMERLGGQGGANTSDRAVEIILELGGSEFARFIIDSINKLQRQEGRTLLKI